MNKLSLEDFVDYYVEAALEAIQNNSTNLDAFDEYILTRVFERTGFSREEIKSLHHPFHWNLFLEKTSPLELVTSKKGGNNYEIRVRQENSSLDKSKLVSSILEEYGILLQQKLDKILK